MKKLILFLLLALPLCAQTEHTFPALDTDNTFTGPNLFNLLQMKNHTVAELSGLSPTRNGLTELVTDGATAEDCTSGSGSFYVLCYYKVGDMTWHPYFTGAGALVSAEYLAPLFTTNCSSPTTCNDIVFTPIGANPYLIFATPPNPTLGLPYPTNFSGASASSTACDDYTSALTSAACDYSAAVSAGSTAVPHHLIACIMLDSGTGVSVSAIADTLLNTWTQIAGQGCWKAHSLKSGADTVTFTLSGASSYSVKMFEEVGADADNPVDVTATTGTGTTTQTWTVTTSQADGYTLVYLGGGAGRLGFQTNSATATYNEEIQSTHDAGGGLGHSFITSIGWGQMASTGSNSITVSCTAGASGTCTNTGLLMAFKPAGPSIPAIPNFLFMRYSYLSAGGDFPAIASGNAGDSLVVNALGTGITLGAAPSGTSIQFKNGGSNYGSPLSGAGSMNFVNCTVSGTTPDFTITCSATGTINVNSSSVSNANFNDTTPATATNGYNVKWQASGSNVSAYVPGYGTIGYGVSYQGAVGASATGLIQVAAASTLPANLATPTTTCKCGTNPTSSFVITLKDGASTVGTITLDSSCAATLATTGGTTQALAADDQLYAVAPGSADATAANISCLVRASRN